MSSLHTCRDIVCFAYRGRKDPTSCEVTCLNPICDTCLESTGVLSSTYVRRTHRILGYAVVKQRMFPVNIFIKKTALSRLKIAWRFDPLRFLDENTHKHVIAILYEQKYMSRPVSGEFMNGVIGGFMHRVVHRKRPKTSGFRALSHSSLRSFYLVPHPNLIHENMVRIIKYVTGQFIVHTDTIHQFFRGEGGVFDLNTKLCFK